MNAAFRRKTIQNSLWMKKTIVWIRFSENKGARSVFPIPKLCCRGTSFVLLICVWRHQPKCRMWVFWLVLPLVLKKTNAWNESNWVSVDVEWTQPAQSLSLAKKKKKKNDSCFVWFERSLYWRVCWKLVSDFFFFALEDRHCFCFAFVSRPDCLVLVKVWLWLRLQTHFCSCEWFLYPDGARKRLLAHPRFVFGRSR